MPEIPDKCEFEVENDQIELRTKTNGDVIKIVGINLDQDNSAALAFLINHPNHLIVKIEEKT